jgi:hypothetical protein
LLTGGCVHGGDVLAGSLDANDFVSNKRDAGIDGLFAKLLVHPYAIDMQSTDFEVKGRTRKPRKGEVFRGLTFAGFYDHAALQGSDTVCKYVVQGQAKICEKVGCGPIQRLADGLARGVGRIDADGFQARFCQVQGGCLSGQAAPDNGNVAGCDRPLIGHG